MRGIYIFSAILFLSYSALALPVEKEVSIDVVGPPLIQINSPKNLTYFENSSIVLNVLSNGDNLRYRLDGGNNFTILSLQNYSIYVGEGTHIIEVYSNNSYGSSNKNISFTIDLDAYDVLYDEFKGVNRGRSTEFDALGIEELDSVQKIILERIPYGSISFRESINIKNDSNPTDNITDIDSGVEILYARIEVETSKLPNFDREAKIEMYGLNFAQPKILRDGVDCGAVCKVNNYFGGNFSFNVSAFSVYSVVEGASINPGGGSGSSGGGGGGGGASRPSTYENLVLDKNQFKASLKQGEIKRDSVFLENIKDYEMTVVISDSFKGLIDFSERKIELKPGEKKEVIFEIKAFEDTYPDLYLGEIIFESGGERSIIQGVIEVNSKNSLFDIRIEIIDKYRSIVPGEEIKAIMSIFNLGETGRVDAQVTYQIVDSDGKIIGENKEMIAVETQTSFAREFSISENILPGNYMLVAIVEYDGKRGLSSDSFEIKSKKDDMRKKIAILLVLAIVLCLIISRKLWRRGIIEKIISEAEGFPSPR